MNNMKKIFVIGASSVIANSIVDKFLTKDNSYEVVKITRNKKYMNDDEFIFIDSYKKLNESICKFDSTSEDIIILAFAYLGKIGFDDNTPQSLDIENQNKVFDINFMQMKEALNTSINFLKRKGGTIIYLSSAAAYPVRPSNIPYGLSKKYIDELILKQKVLNKKFEINTLSVKIGFVDTPLNHGKTKTPFSTTPNRVADKVLISLEKKKDSVFVPGVLYIITRFLITFPKISNFLDKKFI